MATGLKLVHPLLHGDAYLQERVDLLAKQIDFVEDVLVGVVGKTQATGLVPVGDEHGSEIPLQAITLGKAVGITPDADHLPVFQKVGHVAVHHIAHPIGGKQPAGAPVAETHHQGIVVTLKLL